MQRTEKGEAAKEATLLYHILLPACNHVYIVGLIVVYPFVCVYVAKVLYRVDCGQGPLHM